MVSTRENHRRLPSSGEGSSVDKNMYCEKNISISSMLFSDVVNAPNRAIPSVSRRRPVLEDRFSSLDTKNEVVEQRGQFGRDDQEQKDTMRSPIEKTKELLNILNNTIEDQIERIEAIDDVCGQLDHREKSVHDEELKFGAANILFQKLSLAVLLEQNQALEEEESVMQETISDRCADHTTEEIAMLCCALEMVYRANRGAVKESFHRIGRSMLLTLARILHRRTLLLVKGVFSRKHQSYPHDECSEESDGKSDRDGTKHESYDRIIVHNVVKILRSFAKYGAGSDKQFMIERKSIRSALLEIIKWPKDEEPRNKTSPCFRANALAIVGFLAEEESYRDKLILLSHPGLLETVMTVAQKDSEERTREQASFALMNLVNIPKRCLSGKQQKMLFDSLVALVENSSAGATRYAGATIFNLAYSEEYALQLVQHQNGAILDAMLRIMTLESGSKSKTNAAWALFYLSGSRSRDAIRILAEHPGLVQTLSNLVRDDESVVKVPAAKTLRKLSEKVDRSMTCHSSLLEALVLASLGRSDEAAER